MTKAPALRVAIYARISEDPLSQEKGVQRQLEDCRALVESRGWHLVEEFVDNDVSATSGRARPRYEALLQAIDAGRVDRVATYMTSRLWRNRRERADGIEKLRGAKVGIVAVKGPDLDLSTAAGRMLAGLLGEFDTMESEVKAERVARASEQRAKDGQANGTIPFGWDRIYDLDDKGRRTGWRDVVNPAEAAVVREIVDRILFGESQKAIVADLNGRGLRSPSGKAWRASTVRKIALRESNVARRIHQGRVIGSGNWPPLVDDDKHARVVALLEDPARRTSRDGQRRHLLTGGIGECGVCGGPLRVATKGGNQLYVCEQTACVGRRQERVDEVVHAVMVGRLSEPDIVDLVGSDDVDAAAALERAEGIRARLNTAADMWAKGSIDAEQLDRIGAELRPLLAEAETEYRLALSPGRASIAALTGPDVEGTWHVLPVGRQRAVMAALGVRVRILPTRQGRGFDPLSVDVCWPKPAAAKKTRRRAAKVA